MTKDELSSAARPRDRVERDGIEHAPDRWEVLWARVFQAVGEVHEVDERQDIGCGSDHLDLHTESSPMPCHSAVNHLKGAKAAVEP
ncbi:hypothetical protein [Streptomyces phaeoluteigriseus]